MEEGFFDDTDKIAVEVYSISPDILKASKKVTEEIRPVLRDIENIVEFNQLKY